MWKPEESLMKRVLRREKNKSNFRKIKGDEWAVDGIHGEVAKPYEKSFKELFESPDDFSFSNLVRHRPDMNICDLFGDAPFLKSSDYDYVSNVFGVRLKDKNLSPEPKTTIVEANLFNLGEWKKIEKSMCEKGIEGFELITCRPVGGFQFSMGWLGNDKEEDLISAYKKTFLLMLQRVYSRLLSPNNGLLLSSIPLNGIHLQPIFTDDDLSYWKEFLANSINFEYYTAPHIGSVKIVKRPDSPEKLPIPSAEIT